ncbi:MAG: CoA transferase subunit A [Syntrophomonadaceae bacterium]|jgi:glutaconate CoA-transferase subunit A
MNLAFNRESKPKRTNKVVSLPEAISEVKNGDVLMLGAFIDTRRPMAAAYEIVRQKKRDLILLAQCSLAEDILVGAGCAIAWRGCYTGMATFGLSPATLRRIEEGKFFPDEIGHLDIIHGAMAAMVGSPFVGTRATLGSDVLNENLNRNDLLREKAGTPGMIPQKKFLLMEDPFFNSGTVKLLPAMPADIAIIHTQMAGELGTARISGSLAFDHYFVHAARKVIITTEQIVPEEYLRRDPSRNQVPCTAVDMVVEVPWGGHPSQVQGFYDTDIHFIREYAASAHTDEGFNEWAEEWIWGITSRDQYLDKLGASRLQRLRAADPWGYRSRSGKSGNL